jgi:hypothetical protein
MGRTKVPIKKIASEKSRLTCFNKRKGGLFKKAMELSILCDVDVTLIVKAPNGKFQAYSTSSLDAAIADYRKSDQTIPVSHNKHYDAMFGKGGAGADDNDDDEAETKASSARAKRAAAAAPKRKKPGNDEEGEGNEEDDNDDEDYGGAASSGGKSVRVKTERAVPVSTESATAINNPFLSLPSSVVSPGAVPDFTNFSSWNPDLDKLIQPVSGAPPPPPSQPSNVVGASVVKKEGKRQRKQQPKQKKKPGPALSLDTSQQSFTTDSFKGSGSGGSGKDAIEMAGSPPPFYMQGNSLGGLTPSSAAGFALPSFGLGAFPSTPFPATPNNMSL